MGTVERDGITLVYDEVGGATSDRATSDRAAGDGVAGGERPMLLIHGMSCDRVTMGKQLEHFGRTRRTVAYDQRGHGDSDKPLDAAYDPAALADDARWLIRELGLERPVVVGHSLGGTIALALVAANPELASALVMLDSTFGFDAEGRAELDTFYDALTEDSYAETIAAFTRQRMFDTGDDPAMEERMVEVMSGCPLPVFLGMGRGLLQFDVPAAVAAVPVPTLFIGSSRPWVDFGVIRQARPDWYVGRTIGAGHFHNYLVPEQVNAMIDTFLARLSAGQTSAEPGDL